MLQFMGSQKVGYDLATELNQTEGIGGGGGGLLANSCLTLATPGLYPARLLCPWDSPGKNTTVH